MPDSRGFGATVAQWTRRLGLTLCALSLVTIGVGCGGGKAPQAKPTPQMDSSTKARMAQSMLNAGRISEALESIDEAIAMDPQKATLHHFRGTILFQAGRYQDAESSFTQALELDPYYTDARNFLGTIYAELGRPSDAETQYKRALDDPAYPSPEKVHLNLALLFADQGRDTESLEHLRTSVEINPKYYQAHFELASTLDRMGQLEEAAQIYEVAEPGYRASGDYYYRLGLTYFKLGDAFKSREALRRAIDVAPGSQSAAQAAKLLDMVR